MRKQKLNFYIFAKEANFFHAPPTVQNLIVENKAFKLIFMTRDLYQVEAAALCFNLIYNMSIVMIWYCQNLT